MNGPQAQTSRRTDPRGLIARAAESLRRGLLPLVALAFTMRSEMADYPLLAVAAAALVLTASLAIAWLRWTRLTYTVGVDDIRVDSGLVARAARAVPYERIQDVSLEQALIPRLFGLVEVRFETGAGGKDELKLAYLSQEDGESLRALVRERREDETTGSRENVAQITAADPAELLYAITPRRLLTFGLFEFSLVAVAALFGATQQFDFLLPFDPWEIEEWQARLAGPGQWIAGLGIAAQVLGAVVAVASLLVVGFATGLVRTALREWGFALERTARGLRRRRGLLTRTDVTMPLHRIQALRIDTGFVRERFGWHGLKIVSLASDSGAANQDVAPFARIDEIAPIVALTGFSLPCADLVWRGSAARYRFDRWLMSSAIFTLTTLAVALPLAGDPRLLAVLLPGIGALGAHAWLRWRRDRHALGARQLYSRSGWFAPRLTILSRVKLQSVEILQDPLARRRGYATLHLGLAGGVAKIGGMALDEALHWRRSVLASIAGTDFSELLLAQDGDPL